VRLFPNRKLAPVLEPGRVAWRMPSLGWLLMALFVVLQGLSVVVRAQGTSDPGATLLQTGALLAGMAALCLVAAALYMTRFNRAVELLRKDRPGAIVWLARRELDTEVGVTRALSQSPTGEHIFSTYICVIVEPHRLTLRSIGDTGATVEFPSDRVLGARASEKATHGFTYPAVTVSIARDDGGLVEVPLVLSSERIFRWLPERSYEMDESARKIVAALRSSD
jgi:hypothetical protein